MTEHPEKADEVERELDELQHESERLDDDISGVRDDWERKKQDGAVPGAGDGTEVADAEGGA